MKPKYIQEYLLTIRMIINKTIKTNMKMKNVKLMLVAVLGIILTNSCSSDDEGDTNPDAFVEVSFNAGRLQGERWFNLDVIDNNGNSVIDDVLPDCRLDDYYLFDDLDNTYEVNAFTFDCAEDEGKKILDSGSYTLNESENTITFNNGENISTIYNVHFYRDNNGFGNTKMTYTVTDDPYTFELRRGVFQ